MPSAITAPRLPVRSHHRLGYGFGLGLGLAVAAATALTSAPVAAGPIDLAVWTFENSAPASAGPHGADDGLYAEFAMLTAQHADPSVNYTSPLGNGSPRSFAANRWRAGDFVSFSAPTTGFESIELSWDWTRSGTASESFALQWSTDGVQFSTLVSELLITPVTWSSSTYNPASTVGPIALPGAAADQAMVHFRLMALIDAAGVTGTVRFDNVRIAGMTIPGPGAALLLGGALVPGKRRRRHR